MPSILSPPRRADRPERIDSHEPSDEDFAASFGDIARVNRFLGGTAAILRPLDKLIADATAGTPTGTPVRMLDIATGSADIPRAIARRLRQRKQPSEITATDNHPKVLALARRVTPPDAFPEIRVEAADALNLPYPDSSFDIALCSMALHHLSTPDAVTALREMERVTTTGFIVNDLLRDRVACALIWVLTRLVRANHLTRHDAPLSVLRAFTLPEYRAMAREAGIPGVKVYVAPMYRAVLVRNRRGLESAVSFGDERNI